MICESCGKEISSNEQTIAEQANVCFECWDTCNFRANNELLDKNYNAWDRYIKERFHKAYEKR